MKVTATIANEGVVKVAALHLTIWYQLLHIEFDDIDLDLV
jgi:hypothetical protein